eukprot:Skav210388  [mRNA]  locus=scaffold1526:346357:350934:- [translate_table: standard]
MWNLCFSALTRARSGLSALFHAMLGSSACEQQVPRKAVWPMPLPFPEMHRRGSNRKQKDASRKLALNFLVLTLDWLAVGGSLDLCGSLSLGSKLTRDQWTAVRRLTPLVDSWNSHDLVDASAMGRSASKVENIELLLVQLEQQAIPFASELRSYMHKSSSGAQNSSGPFGHPGVVVGSVSSSVDCVAKDLEPDRLVFHGVPSFDPSPFLDDRNRAQYQRPLDFACSISDLTVRVPAVRVRCSRKLQLGLLQTLDASKRLALIPARLARAGLENGMFAIPKDQTRDRLIMDARPGNLCEESEARWVHTLGSVHQLLHVFLESHQELLVHCEGLREFYHAFVITEQRQIRNCLKLRFRPSELQHLQCYDRSLDSEDWLVPALATMAMGDTNSVAYGQVSHLSLLLRTQEFELSDFLGLKVRPSRKHWHAGLMIDDFILLEAVESALVGSSDTLGQSKVAVVRDAYEKVGLPRHSGKSVSASSFAEFWGTEVDGQAGRARPCLKRLIPLVHILLKVLRLRVCSVGLLEVLAGSLVSAFQMKRRFMSVLQEIYCAQRGRLRTDVIRLSPQLCDELFCCVGLLVLTEIDFRLHPCPWLVASDASSSASASVFSDVGVAFSAEAQRYGLQKGLWNRLMSPAGAYLREKGILADSVPELPEKEYDMHPLWEEVVASQQFALLRKRIHRGRRKHINLHEISAALDAECAVGEKWKDSYYVHLQDSQVSLACLVKGRSSSFAANQLLRKSIPMHITNNVRPFYGFVRTKLNPSDDPTRDRPVRSPCREEALWIASAKKGDFAELDDFLSEQKLGVLDMAGLPDPSELLPDLPIQALSAQEKRKVRGKHMRQKKPSAVSAEGDSSSKSSEDPQAVRASLSTVRSRTPSVQSAACRCGPGISGPVRVSAPATGPETELKNGKLPEALVQRLLKFRPEQFVFSSKFADLSEALRDGPGVLDLFSGARGFSRAFTELVPSWSLCFDISHHPDENLEDVELQSVLLGLLQDGAFKAMAASPVCASFSTAITPPWRTLEFPEGRPDVTAEQRLKMERGHVQLKFVLKLCAVCIQTGVIFWVENPDASWFWRQREELSWDSLQADKQVGDFRIDQCRFGTPWRKRTKFRTNCSLRGQRLLCRCSTGHVILRGRCKERKINFTKLAESYPRKLCRLIACGVAQDLGLLPGRRKLIVDDCAKCCGLRIGEASHPGPRRPRAFERVREGRLEDVELLEPQTIAMRARFWSSFTGWVSSELGDSALESIVANPLLLVKALEKYGGLEYSAGTPLHYYRQLLAHVQREYPMIKVHMAPAWRMVSKWELLEPVQHRPPIPEPLVLAMSCLALSWDWPYFTAAVLMCFYGICRIGEVLSAARCHLLTPQDLMSDDEVIYLKICKPKSRNRGPSTQYSTVSERSVVSFLAAVWQQLQPESLLYPSSPSNFRRRWNTVLKILGVPSWHRLTPGSLRGGGCVAAHRKGLAIHDLLWKMRLQHTKTLGYYLQETTAESVLPALTPDCRDNIKALRSMLPFLLETFQQRTAFK